MSISSLNLPKLIVILGPTASGKTGWAFKLCEEFSAQGGGEIVSADSRQIYRYMNIGTGKEYFPEKVQSSTRLPASPPASPNRGENRGEAFGNPRRKFKVQMNIKNQIQNIPQYLIDVVNPDEILTLSEYKKLAVEKINDIISRGKIPFLVGGTGLYISAIVDNLEIPEVEPDWQLREKLELKSIDELQGELRRLDSEAYAKIDLNNRRRLIRAIEVCKQSGKHFSSLQKKSESLFDCLQIGIDVPREELNKKIDARVDEMQKAGLEEEVWELAKKYSWNLPSMSGIGYREFAPPLNPPLREGGKPTDEIFDEIKKHTRQYAKRQMTWFRRDSRIEWARDCETANKIVKNFLTASE